tara:strand:+ start:254 stop:433 length:180 start_codon:yes stop_codon:yes gene_type:complete
MTEISKPLGPQDGHDHAQGGGCCGGAKAKPQAVPAEKATDAPEGGIKAKPAGSSGCCCS